MKAARSRRNFCDSQTRCAEYDVCSIWHCKSISAAPWTMSPPSCLEMHFEEVWSLSLRNTKNIEVSARASESRAWLRVAAESNFQVLVWVTAESNFQVFLTLNIFKSSELEFKSYAGAKITVIIMIMMFKKTPPILMSLEIFKFGPLGISKQIPGPGFARVNHKETPVCLECPLSVFTE